MRVVWLALEWPKQGEPVGGVGRHLLRLASEMSSLCHLTIVTGDDPVPIPGVDLCQLGTFDGRTRRYYLAPIKAARTVRTLGFDVLHAHGDDWAVPRSGRPLIRTFYGSSFSEAMASRGLRRINHLVLFALELVASVRADVRIGIAGGSGAAFRVQHVFPPVAGLGLRRPAADTGKPRHGCLFIGSWGGKKRGELAQGAVLAAAHRAGVEPRLTVVCSRSDAGKWAPWVDVHVEPDDAQVSDLLRSSSVLLAPSSYEGFGIPSVEGLAAGCVVVTTSNPGSRYIAGLGVPASMLYVAEDDGDLVNSLRTALGAVPPPSDVAQAADAMATMQWAGSAERLVQMYDSALRGSRS